MKDKKTYGDCLFDILGAINLKSSKLAREINIDSSLVYKWLRNERVPSFESPYIDLILNCISKRLANVSQKEALIDVLKQYDIELPDCVDSTILKSLRQILQKSQGYSIRLHNELKSHQKLLSSKKSNVESLIQNHITDQDGGTCNQFNSLELSGFVNTKGSNHLFGSLDHVQIIESHPEIIFTAVQLLKETPITPSSEDNTILLTLNSDLTFLFDEKDINQFFMNKLYHLLHRGWHIICKIKLDNNVSRTVKIIKSLQNLLAAGKLTIYYCKNASDHANETELCIIPGTGALFSFATHRKDQVDSAFLFRSNKIITMLSSRFFYDLHSAKLLLKSYPPQNSAEFQREFTESEETPGNKYVLKGGLSTVTIPLDLYERYLRQGNMTEQEISHRMLLHKRRLDAFEIQVKYFHFKDICFIESIYELVDKRSYSFDEQYILSHHLPNYGDIICHLENVISLLKNHHHYEIAFVSHTMFAPSGNINWMVKEKNSVLIETINQSHSVQCGSDCCCSEINYIISEKSVINAFHDYFLTLWDQLSIDSSSKKNTIAWLESMIQRCKQHKKD